MNREFLLNIILLIAINFLVKPLYLFGIDAQVQLEVGEKAYGVFFTLFNFAFILQVVNDFGIQNYTSSRMSGDASFIQDYLPKIWGVRIVLSVFFLISVFVGAYLLGYPPSYYPILWIVAINQVLSTFFLFTRAAISASGRYRVDSWISALDKVLMIVILGYLLYIDRSSGVTIYHLLYTQTISFAIALVIGLTLLGRSIGRLHIQMDWQYLPQQLRAAWPYALVLVLMTLYTRLDTVMLERLLPDGDFQAGVYARCYRYFEALSMIGYLFAVLLLPMYARQIKERISLQDLSLLSLRVLVTVVLPVAISVIVFAEELLLWRYADADHVYMITLSLMMLSFTAISLAYIYGTMHAASGELAAVNKVYCAGVVLNVLLNIWLIPSYAVVGAAAATLATQAFVMVGQVYLSHDTFGLRVRWALVLQVTAFAILSFAIASFIQRWHGLPWLAGFLLSILSGGILSLLLRIIDRDMLLSLLRQAR